MAVSDRAISVLHVDDEPEFVKMAAEFVEREDSRFSVDTSTNVDAALDRLSPEEFDCVVSDHDMPGKNGLEFLKAVREEYPELPFILYTGKGSEEIASQAISEGVTDYLQKEASTEQYELLANRIQNAVEQTRAQKRVRRQERILGILRRANQALVSASTRAEIKTAVAGILESVDEYDLIWFGEYDEDHDRVVPNAVQGENAALVGPTSLQGQDDGVLVEAIRTNDLQITAELDRSSKVWDDDVDVPFEGVAVVPLVYQGDRNGFMTIYTGSDGVFDEPEREMLSEMAGDIAQAIHTAETHETLQRHQTAVETVPEGVFILDEDATLELINARGVSLVGLSMDAVQGRPFPELVEDGIFDQDIIEWYVESVREMLSSESERQEARYQTEVDPPDGEARLIEVHLTLRPYDEEFRGTVGLVRDITERAEREARLRKQQAFNEVALDSVIDFYWVLDMDGYVTDWSDTDGSVTGYTPEEAIERHATDFFPEYERDYIAQQVEELRETGEITAEADFKTQHGPLVPYRFDGTVLTDSEGTVERMCGFGQDISARRDHERELERQNEQLERLTSVLSHDLRNLLTVAQGRLKLATEEHQSVHLENASESMNRSVALIDDLLTLTREGKEVQNLQVLELEETVHEAWATIAAQQGSLRVESSRDLHADPSRLQQLLENLLANAVEHGGDEVTITVGALEDGFYVADNGPGIPSEQRGEVFEMGYSSLEDGTGFGLNIVREIAEAHGWEVSVMESDTGGARFEVTGIESP